MSRWIAFLTVAVVLSAPLASAQTAGLLPTAPKGVTLVYGSDPRTTVTLTWFTEEATGPVEAPSVKYGTTPSFGASVPAKATKLEHEASTIWSATLMDLAPGTTYHYKAGSDLLGWTRDLAFTTAPDGIVDTFVVTAYGDQGSAIRPDVENPTVRNGEVFSPRLRSVEVALAQSPVVHLHLGDLAYGDWDGWQLTVEPLASRVPYMASLGNHDGDSWFEHTNYRARVPMPAEPERDYYAFTYGNVRFVSLDTENWCMRELRPPLRPTFSPKYVCHDEQVNVHQLEFIEREFAAARSDPDIQWLIPFFHKPIVAGGTRGVHPEIQRLWTPLFDQYRPDLVLQGHDHFYERSKPLLNGTVDPDGVTYLVSGGAGKSLYNYKEETPPEWEAARAKEFHVTVLRFAGDTLDVEAIDLQGKKLDSFTLKARGPMATDVDPPPAPGNKVPAPPIWLVALAAIAVAFLARRRVS